MKLIKWAIKGINKFCNEQFDNEKALGKRKNRSENIKNMKAKLNNNPTKLLLVEDQPGDALILQKIISRIEEPSFKIVRVDCLKKSLDRLTENTFDIILLDLNLPDSTGLKTLTRLHKEANQIPIVVLTGLYDKQIALEAIKQGAQDYLHKDKLNEDMLLRVIRYAIERNRIKLESQESEKKYFNLFNNSMNGFALHEIVINNSGEPIDYIFLEANKAFERIVGLKAKDVIGKRVTKVMPGIEEDPFIQIYGKVALTGEPIHFEQYSKALNRHLEITAFAPQEGQFAAIFMDITERKSAERELKDREQKLRTIVEHSNELFYIHNCDHKLTYVSPQVKKIMGYTSEEMMVKWTTLITDHPMNAEGIRITEKAISSGERQAPYLLEVRKRNGEHRIVEIDESPIKNQNGEVTGISGVLRDITEQRKAELALKESEGKFRSLAEQSPNMIFINRSGRIVYANKKCEEMMGYSRDEFYAPEFNFLSLIAPESMDLIKRNFSRHENNEEVEPYEYILLNRAGKRIDAIITTKLINYQSGYAILGIVTDITERKQAEGDLLQSEEKYRALFEESKDAIYVSSVDGKFSDINPAGVQLFGYDSKDELLNVDIAHDLYLNPSDRQKFQNELRSKGHVRDFEVDLRKKNGTKITVLVTSTGIKNEKEMVVGYRGIIRDITEKKQLEQQLLQAQKMEAIGTLAGGIAHDFNNILSAILGYTELTKDIITDDGMVSKNLDQVYKAGLRAKDLIQQILTFSRQKNHQPQPLQIELIIKEALKLMRASFPATIEIRQNLNGNGGFVFADPTQMHQVMMNLCTNAYDAMRKKGGLLEVSLNKIKINGNKIDDQLELPGGDYIKMTIGDTGTGMDRETAKRVFDPFFTTKDAGSGTGLGLSVVHGIVKKHDGEITVESEPGKGTTFNIYIPEFKPKHKMIIEKQSEYHRGHENILYVDDEEFIVETGVKILEKLGYHVTGKTQSLEALEAFKQSPEQFDLVISDLTMPNMTGLDLAKNILKIRSDIPIILITGFNENVSKDMAKKMGIRDLIMKPILTADLSKTIREILNENTVGI